MTPISQPTFKPIAPVITVEGAANVRITNISTTASVEASLALVSGLKAIEFRARGKAETRFAFVSGDTSIKYMTLPVKNTYSRDGLTFTGKTLFLRTDIDDTIEVVEYF